jgi:hypothetical protein
MFSDKLMDRAQQEKRFAPVPIETEFIPLPEQPSPVRYP